MKSKITSTIAGASVFITFFGLMSKSLGVVRESIFANFFGLSSEYDLFLVSVVLPVSINTIVIYIAQNLFIPTYHKYKSELKNDEEEYLNYCFWTFIFGGILLSGLFLIFSRPYLSYYLGNHSEETILTAIYIFRIYVFSFVFNSGYAILAAYSHAVFQFKYPILSQLFLNILVIFSVIFFSDKIGVYSIPIGYLTGTIFQFLFILYKLKPKLQISFIGYIRNRKFSILRFSFLSIILIEVLGQMYILIDRAYYKFVDPGGIAALNYSFSLINLPLAIIAVALGNAMFPSISKYSSMELKTELSQLIRKYFTINIFIFTLITTLYIFFGDLFIKILFERGKFNSDSTYISYQVLLPYTLGLIFFSSYGVINKILYSYAKLKLLLLVTSFSIISKIILSYYLVLPLKQEGLALSTSLSYIILFFLSCYVISHFIKIKFLKFFIYESIYALFNAILAILIVQIIDIDSYLKSQLLEGIINVLLFIVLYVISAIILKNNSVWLFWDLINRLLKFNYHNKFNIKSGI